MKILILLLVLLVSLSWSKEKQKVEVPINIGVGPAFFWIPGVVGRELHSGTKFDFYEILTSKMQKENENKTPKKYKKFENKKEEIHFSPLWMSFIPKYLIISPGAENSIYGGIWSFLSIEETIFDNKFIKLDAEVVLPTISYLYTNAQKNAPNTQHLLGIGAMLRYNNTIRFNEKFLATLAYGHNFNLPLFTIGPIPNNTYKEANTSERQQWFQTGVLSLVFHFRFNTKQKT